MKTGWTLSQQAFDALLAWLAPDRDEAGVVYEGLQRRLVRLFEWWGDPGPDQRADETLNRAARRLLGGEQVRTSNPYAYLRGVARLVFREGLRERRRSREALALWGAAGPEPPDPREEQRLECLDLAVAELAPEQRDLILRYYAEGNQIALRRRHARELSVTLNTLRIRTHRVRARLGTRTRHLLDQASS